MHDLLSCQNAGPCIYTELVTLHICSYSRYQSSLAVVLVATYINKNREPIVISCIYSDRKSWPRMLDHLAT